MGITAAVVGVGSAVAGMFTTAAISTTLAGVIGGAVIGAVVGGLTSAITGGNILSGVLFGAIGGAVSGGLAGASIGGTVQGGVVSSATSGSISAAGLSATPSTVAQSVTSTAVEGTVGVTLESIGAQVGVAALSEGAKAWMSASAAADQAETDAEVAAANREHEEEMIDKQAAYAKELKSIVAGTDNTASELSYEARMAELDQRKIEFNQTMEQQRKEFEATEQTKADRQALFGSEVRRGDIEYDNTPVQEGIYDKLQDKSVNPVGESQAQQALLINPSSSQTEETVVVRDQGALDPTEKELATMTTEEEVVS